MCINLACDVSKLESRRFQHFEFEILGFVNHNDQTIAFLRDLEQRLLNSSYMRTRSCVSSSQPGSASRRRMNSRELQCV